MLTGITMMSAIWDLKYGSRAADSMPVNAKNDEP